MSAAAMVVVVVVLLLTHAFCFGAGVSVGREQTAESAKSHLVSAVIATAMAIVAVWAIGGFL